MTSGQGSAVVRVTQLPGLPPRPVDSHKGDYGHVLVVAGSAPMAGACVLACTGALRGGAGLVTAATSAEGARALNARLPEAMTVVLPGDAWAGTGRAALRALLDAARGKTVAVLGPGLGQDPATAGLLAGFLEAWDGPVLLDADALNVLAARPAAWAGRRRPAVLTPHPGEFAHLAGCDTATVQAAREPLAVDFAARHGVILVLKGAGTVVSDGARVYVNDTGNPGMATAGAGDVLAGLAGAFLGRKGDILLFPPFLAAALAVRLHGRAGDLAAAELGQTALTATDIAAHLPAAIREVE